MQIKSWDERSALVVALQARTKAIGKKFEVRRQRIRLRETKQSGKDNLYCPNFCHRDGKIAFAKRSECHTPKDERSGLTSEEAVFNGYFVNGYFVHRERKGEIQGWIRRRWDATRGGHLRRGPHGEGCCEKANGCEQRCKESTRSVKRTLSCLPPKERLS